MFCQCLKLVQGIRRKPAGESRFDGGVDLLGTARAILRGASRGGDIRGTSTITQQLSRNVFLPYIKSQRTLNRKIQEVILAGALEKRFTKEEILEAYLNHTYFGARAYGVKAAALTYFGKDLDQLSLSECAMLAGMPQAPSKYNPFTNMDGAQVRRDSVLKLLDSRLSTDFIGHLKLADPQKFKDLDISSADIEKALKQPIKLSKKTAPGILRAPYFVEYLREHVLGPKYGRDRVAVDGLVVVTTIDPTYQEWAENILASELDKDRRSKRVSEGALLVYTMPLWVAVIQIAALRRIARQLAVEAAQMKAPADLVVRLVQEEMANIPEESD